MTSNPSVQFQGGRIDGDKVLGDKILGDKITQVVQPQPNRPIPSAIAALLGCVNEM